MVYLLVFSLVIVFTPWLLEWLSVTCVFIPLHTLDWVSWITRQYWRLSEFELCSSKESINFRLLTTSFLKNLCSTSRVLTFCFSAHISFFFHGKTVCGLGVRVLLFKERVASFSSSTCDDRMFKQWRQSFLMLWQRHPLGSSTHFRLD